LVSLLLDGAMKDPLSMGWPQSVALNPELELTKVMEKYRLHSGFFYAIALSAGLAFVMARTTFGFEMRAVGANRDAARFAGMPVNRITLWTAALSGALAGLAGVFEVAGRTGYVTLDMSPGYGYSGIVVATLALLNPLGVVLAAIFIAGVLVGADGMSRALAVPTYIADVIVAVALLSMLVAALLSRYRIQWR
jgi:general nucleoside transport system permease protein